MDQFYDSGLFTELGELMAHDQAFYEDTPKQHFNASSSFNECQPSDSAELAQFEHLTPGDGDVLDSLLMEGNHLLDRFMAENGLDLLTAPVDLSDVDELVSSKISPPYHQRPSSLLNLDEMSSYDTSQQVPSPTSSISTLPSEPSSPVNLFSLERQPQLTPAVPAGSTPEETRHLNDLLESLLGDQEDQVNYEHYDYELNSPASSDFSYSSSSPDTCYDTSYTSLSPDTSCDGLSSQTQTTYNDKTSCKSGGKTKSKRKSKSTPYNKLPAARKERKKQQNKEAAIRYREKKRSEAAVSQTEEQQLLERNKDLKTEVLNLEREIMCMKELLSDVFNIHSL